MALTLKYYLSLFLPIYEEILAISKKSLLKISPCDGISLKKNTKFIFAFNGIGS